jgi:hypothetical protein
MQPIHHGRPVARHRIEFPIERAPIFIALARHVHHLPHASIARDKPHQHQHQLLGIRAVVLHAPRAAVHFNTGGIDDVILDAARVERAMQPEPIAPGLVAADHASGGRQREAPLRARDLVLEPIKRARGDAAHPRPLAEAGRKRQLPRRAQFQREVERCDRRRSHW